MRGSRVFWAFMLLASHPVLGQEPVSWGLDLEFSTFSIAAVDPATGEVGVAVTTRVACVGNGVPWVRAGVGAVATQASTRTVYGTELLDMLAGGATAEDAMARATSADESAARRQVGVIGLRGGSAQHTGERTNPWAGHRSGTNYVTQGNLLVGPQVLEAVGENFEASEGTARHLADRLIEALAAGQHAGGDARKGRVQSAAVVVADAREGRSRRPDGITANINVCEHPTPVAELRRIYDTISETLGFRELSQPTGRDVWQLKLMLNALGYFRPDAQSIEPAGDGFVYNQQVIDAVDAFRAAEGLSGPGSGSPAGLVDKQTVERLWSALARLGKDGGLREQLKRWTEVRR
jgi:uncharacterized Ntn-hydrolase superfamily protein